MRRSTLILFLLLTACSQRDRQKRAIEGEYIYRKSDDHFFAVPPSTHQTRESYPWEKGYVGQHPRITKEFFRCKGTHCNPVRILTEGKETRRLSDCGGADAHGLPQRNGEAYISPILIELLNDLQEQTGMRVVITCGHRCPTHNSYSDPRQFNNTSKHMIGAEVDFYIQGMEENPEQVVELLQNYYLKQPRCKNDKESYLFQRYHKENTDVSTAPWYNREIFVKLYKSDEGRDYDNRHPYPYIGIQVRRDYDLDEPVVYSWERASSYFR